MPRRPIATLSPDPTIPARERAETLNLSLAPLRVKLKRAQGDIEVWMDRWFVRFFRHCKFDRRRLSVPVGSVQLSPEPYTRNPDLTASQLTLILGSLP